MIHHAGAASVCQAEQPQDVLPGCAPAQGFEGGIEARGQFGDHDHLGRDAQRPLEPVDARGGVLHLQPARL